MAGKKEKKLAEKKAKEKKQAQKQEKKAVKVAVEKSAASTDIWAPEENAGKKPAPVAEKPAEKKEEKKEEKAAPKAIHFATAQELEKSGIDTGIIFYPLITEKAVNMIESQNKLCFVVAEAANKTQIRKTVEAMYGAKVDAVNIVRDMKGRKKAIVKINKKFKADEIAMKLGVI